MQRTHETRVEFVRRNKIIVTKSTTVASRVFARFDRFDNDRLEALYMYALLFVPLSPCRPSPFPLIAQKLSCRFLKRTEWGVCWATLPDAKLEPQAAPNHYHHSVSSTPKKNGADASSHIIALQTG